MGKKHAVSFPVNTFYLIIENGCISGLVHRCEFMPFEVLVREWVPYREVWELSCGEDDGALPVFFCPYCGLKLCEPETP